MSSDALPAVSCAALLGLLYGGKEDRLLPVWRPTSPHPRMRSSHRTSKDGGKAGGAEGETIVPSHAERIHQKEKCAMRKIILAMIYAMRIVKAMKEAKRLAKVHSRETLEEMLKGYGMKIDRATGLALAAARRRYFTIDDAIKIKRKEVAA
jgi:hypothetical protein